jgi:hypothetical protein
MTASTLTTVVAGIQDLILAITSSGIRLAPDSLPNTLQVFPAVLVYPATGRIESNSSGFATELHTFHVELYAAGGDWARAYTKGAALLDVVFRKLEANPTLSGTVQTYGDLQYTFDGEVKISDIPTLRWTIRIVDAKIQHTW